MTGQEETEVLAIVRGLGVVIERMESHFTVFGEGLQAVNQRLDRTDARLETVSDKLDDVDARLSTSLQRLETKVDAGFAHVDRELGLVKAAVLQHDRELRAMGRGAR
jgi:hypothetical protein